MKVRNILMAILFCFGMASVSQAQFTVVNSASLIRWDDGNVGIDTETRVYLERNAGVVPDGLPDASVGVAILEWAIIADNGRWYAVVTAFDPVSGIESGPSNEISFHVLGPPGNTRVVIP